MGGVGSRPDVYFHLSGMEGHGDAPLLQPRRLPASLRPRFLTPGPVQSAPALAPVGLAARSLSSLSP